MLSLVTDLNARYKELPALWSQDTSSSGFRWIVSDDSTNNTLAFVRIAVDGTTLICVANFSAVVHDDYRIGLPRGGTWAEVLNTDAGSYGGSGVGNLGEVHAEDVAWHGLPASAALRVPPLGVLWLRPV